MGTLKFSDCGTFEGCPFWEQYVRREKDIYSREDDVRSPFARDYTRILHSMAYRRLKHKTQVFFNIDNDHICTRMEHVSHVESVSSTIAKCLGLNDELTKAISIGHDLGHAPFGHQGEKVIRELTQKHLHKNFWHEQNGLRFVDKIELLEDSKRRDKNLNLTFAVRDGILSHCGEVDVNGISPRDISIPLEAFHSPGDYQPVTWEGCIVKISDKIAYVGRDIEDAISLKILSPKDEAELIQMARLFDEEAINTTVIMHNMIIDICNNSSPARGITLSGELCRQLEEIKAFNTDRIYNNPRLKPYHSYSELVLRQLFDFLSQLYDREHLWESFANSELFAPTLIDAFRSWLMKYCDRDFLPLEEQEEAKKYINEKIYGRVDTKQIYEQAVIDFISGMTDRFAIKLFQELLQFGYL